MKWSFSIAKIAGIDVRVHVTFLLLLAWYGYGGYESGGATGAKWSVIFITLLFLCVLLHEFGHALAAHRYGIRTPNITLYPIGGLARLERMPENPVQELVIAIAGPLVNVVIGIALWFALGMPFTHAALANQDNMPRMLAAELLQVNGLLIAFNLIPAFPMDGGRVFRALLAMQMSHVAATKIAAKTGQGIAVIFALIGFFGVPQEVLSIPVLGTVAGIFGTEPNPFLFFIAIFVFSGAQQESAHAGMRAAVESLRVADAMISQFHTLPAEMPVAEAAREALRDLQPEFPVTDSNLRPLGIVLRMELLQAASGSQSASTVGLLARNVPVVRADASFNDAFKLMHESGCPVLPVVAPSGQLVGLVSLNLISERLRQGRS